MSVCPHCSHQNPLDAAHCEACGTPLAIELTCPNCAAPIEAQDRFCGQCGFLLQTAVASPPLSSVELSANPEFTLPSPELLSPDLNLEQIAAADAFNGPAQADVLAAKESLNLDLPQSSGEDAKTVLGSPIDTTPPAEKDIPTDAQEEENAFQTKIQHRAAKLLHIQTNQILELSEAQPIFHIGKPNERLMPDINVSNFPNGEVVSRVHAAIQVEQGIYSIEDKNSANGTYLNGMALTPGTPYRLRTGDKICLGKGELVTFIFKI